MQDERMFFCPIFKHAWKWYFTNSFNLSCGQPFTGLLRIQWPGDPYFGMEVSALAANSQMGLSYRIPRSNGAVFWRSVELQDSERNEAFS